MQIAAPYTLDTPAGRITLNPTDGSDGFYLTDVAGMDGAVVRTVVEPVPQADGATVFPAWLGARYPVLEGYIKAVSDADTDENLARRGELEDTLRGYAESMLRADGALRWKPAGKPWRRVTVRLAEAVQIRGGFLKEWQLALVAEDPRVYSDDEHTADTSGLTAGGGSWLWPHGWPHSFGAPSSGGTVTVTNAGTVPTAPVIRLYGYALAPAIVNLTTGEGLSLVNLQLGQGDYAEVDMRRQTVTLNGDDGTSLLGGLDVPRSTFWQLAVGQNQIQYQAAGLAGSAFARVLWRDAWT